jgi:hypothetical protein
MKTLRHGYSKTAFDNAVAAHVEKLTFNTQDEYLIWVKQWKEEYNHMVALRKIQKLDRFTRKDKIEAAAKMQAAIHEKFDPKRSKEIVDALKLRMLNEYGIQFYCTDYYIRYTLIMYLQVVRKAGKIRAGQKMKARLETQKIGV